jgi:hypothetical protein
MDIGATRAIGNSGSGNVAGGKSKEREATLLSPLNIFSLSPYIFLGHFRISGFLFASPILC